MNELKISVIIPSFNQGEFIENCIKSVLFQTYPNWELIIQDGLSKDKTSQICESYQQKDKRISFYSEKDSGFADAVNNALNKCNGDWIIIQSSDDFFSSSKVFEEFIRIQESHPNVSLISGGAIVVDHNYNHLKTSKREETYIQPENVYTLKYNFSQGATFFKKEKALNINKLDLEVDMVADTDFWIRYCCYEPRINSIYQTSLIWCCVMVQENQRSSNLSNFYLGRAKMTLKHLDNPLIPYSRQFKINQCKSLISSAINHFNINKIDIKDLLPLYKLVYKVDYQFPRENTSFKTKLKKFLLRTNNLNKSSSPNKISDIYFKNNLESTGISYKWFD